jgi:hypothetical protein
VTIENCNGLSQWCSLCCLLVVSALLALCTLLNACSGVHLCKLVCLTAANKYHIHAVYARFYSCSHLLQQDKAERKARGGKLAGKLGIEGYQPVGLQQDNSATPATSTAAASSSSGRHAVTNNITLLSHFVYSIV